MTSKTFKPLTKYFSVFKVFHKKFLNLLHFSLYGLIVEKTRFIHQNVLQFLSSEVQTL